MQGLPSSILDSSPLSVPFKREAAEPFAMEPLRRASVMARNHRGCGCSERTGLSGMHQGGPRSRSLAHMAMRNTQHALLPHVNGTDGYKLPFVVHAERGNGECIDLDLLQWPHIWPGPYLMSG
jgi:hypothetical protein